MACRVLPLLLLSAGCLDPEVSRNGLINVAVDVTKVPTAPTEMASRVDQVGRQLVGTNPFLGFEPTFHTLGQSTPEICHPDSGGVFVTAGLVDRCKTDAELAAVLATELAIIRAERRLTERPRKLEPLAALPDGGTGTDPTQLGTQALLDQKLDRRTVPPNSTKPEDRRAVASDILKNAGYDPKVLDDVEPILVEAATHHTAATTFGGRGGKPRWSN